MLETEFLAKTRFLDGFQTAALILKITNPYSYIGFAMPSIYEKMKLIKIVILSLFFSITLDFAYPAEKPKISTILPSISVAVSDDALATDINPAGLGVGRIFNGYYLRTYSGESQKDNALFLSAADYGFSAQLATTPNGIDFHRYTIANGSRITRGLYFGTGYSWYTSNNADYDNLSTWQLGFLYRKDYLSIGAVGRNFILPRILFWRKETHPVLFGKRLQKVYDFSIALRPGTNRITLWMDARHREDIKGFEFSYALEIIPIPRLLFSGRISENMSYSLRFELNLSKIGFGSYNSFNKHGEYQDGVGYLYFSQAIRVKR